jgi:hypothetical protein
MLSAFGFQERPERKVQAASARIELRKIHDVVIGPSCFNCENEEVNRMAGDEPVRAMLAVLHVGFNWANSKPAPSPAARVRHPEIQRLLFG